MIAVCPIALFPGQAFPGMRISLLMIQHC